MFTVFWRTIKDRKYSIIIFSAAGVLLLWLYILMFPSMKEMAGNLINLMEGYPDAFTKMFPITDASFTSIENFLAIEQYSLMVPILIIFMMVAIAAVGLAAEVERGTAEILLSRPISRIKIFFSRYLVGLSSLLVFIIFSTLMIIPLGELHNIDYILINFVSISVLCFIFGWTIFSIAMMLSAIFSERSRVYMIMGGMLVGMYVMQIVSSINEKWENLQYISFFYYYDYNKALLDNSLETTNVLIFVGIAIVCMIVGAYWFNKRDIAVQ
ncbi:ABC transporter permease [Patescibacteria group bacterium]|nr:ABC transporter permease [Patescibacteria group bacterium]